MAESRRDGIAEPEVLNPAPSDWVTPLEALSTSLSLHGIAYDSTALDSSRSYYELAQAASRKARGDAAEIRSLKAKIEATHRALGDLDYAGLSLPEAVAGLRKARREAGEERDAAREEVERLRESGRNLGAEVESCCRANEALKAELERLKNSHASIRKALEYPVAAEGHNLPLVELAQAVAESCNAHEVRVTDLRMQLDKTQRALAESEAKRIRCTGDEMCGFAREVDGLRKLVAESEAKVVALTAEKVAGFASQQTREARLLRKSYRNVLIDLCRATEDDALSKDGGR